MIYLKWKENQIRLEFLIPSNHGNCKDGLTGSWKKKYDIKKNKSKINNIPFELTFDEYLYKCFEVGMEFPSEIGRERNQYQLARYSDIGPYSVNNCRFITQLENIRERNEHYNVSENMKKISKTKIKNKTHHFLNVKPWNSAKSSSSSSSLEVWKRADECYNWWIETGKGSRLLMSCFDFKSRMACQSIIAKFKSGWIPKQDKDWIDWSNNYGLV